MSSSFCHGNAQPEPAQTLHRMSAKGRGTPCYRCGEEHNPQQCRFLDEICRYCKKTGHIARMCRKREQRTRERNKTERGENRGSSVKGVEEEKDCGVGQASDEEKLFWGRREDRSQEQWGKGTPITVDVMVEKIPLQKELDTGAGVSLLPHSIYRQRFLHVPLQKTNTRLRTYTGERIYPRGEIVVSVQKGQKRVRLPLEGCGGHRTPVTWA